MDALRNTSVALVGYNRSIHDPDAERILFVGGVERIHKDALEGEWLKDVMTRIAERIGPMAFSGGVRADHEELPIEIYLTWEDPDGEYALLLWRVPFKGAGDRLPAAEG